MKKQLIQYGFYVAVFVAAMLIAVQLRYDLRYGRALGPKYEAQPPMLYIVMMVSLWLAMVVPYRWRLDRWYGTLLGATALASVGILVLLPDVSQLQVGYFAIVVTILGVLLILLPNRLRYSNNLGTVAANLAKLWDNRILIRVWLQYNIEDRYSQRVLGVLWIVLVPLSTGLVMTLAFRVFLRVELDIPFIVFFFAAFTMYNIFNQGINNGTRSIIRSMDIINQVSFPREVLVLVALGEALIDTFFMFIAMLIINMLLGFWPSLLFVLLVPIVLIMAIFTLGLMLLVSYLSVMLRDVPELVGIGLQLTFYLTPIIYPVKSIPANYQIIFLLNPLVPLIEGARDIIAYQRVPDFLAMVYPLTVGLILLYLGYTLFKANEDYFADMR